MPAASFSCRARNSCTDRAVLSLGRNPPLDRPDVVGPVYPEPLLALTFVVADSSAAGIVLVDCRPPPYLYGAVSILVGGNQLGRIAAAICQASRGKDRTREARRIHQSERRARIPGRVRAARARASHRGALALGRNTTTWFNNRILFGDRRAARGGHIADTRLLVRGGARHKSTEVAVSVVVLRGSVEHVLRQACPERSRRAQHERKNFNVFRPSSVRPEPVEACPELVEGGEHPWLHLPQLTPLHLPHHIARNGLKKTIHARTLVGCEILFSSRS
jgi:hypothetical protein